MPTVPAGGARRARARRRHGSHHGMLSARPGIGGLQYVAAVGPSVPRSPPTT